MLQKRNRTLQYYVNTGENPLEIRTQQNLLYILKALTVKQCSKIRDNFKAIACLTIPYMAMN